MSEETTNKWVDGKFAPKDNKNILGWNGHRTALVWWCDNEKTTSNKPCWVEPIINEKGKLSSFDLIKYLPFDAPAL